MVTINEVKHLEHGDILIHKPSNTRWRVTGKPQTWKRYKNKVKVPIKHGLYDGAHLTEFNMKDYKFENPATKNSYTRRLKSCMTTESRRVYELK
jgi:hypothetical protein